MNKAQTMRFSLPDSVFPPLEDSILKKNNFFELYPLDGGGNFIMRELFGTLKDEEIASRAAEIMAQFGGLPHPDFRRFERWRTIEKSCWVNRCYFLISIARTAWLKQDAGLARTVAGVILHFHRTCLPPEDLKVHWERVNRRMNEDYNGKSREEILKDETDVEYVWYDFQPGQRLISFLYTLYFIRDFDVFTAEECCELQECLKRHVRILYEQERENPLEKCNHQSVRVVAFYWGLPLLTVDPDFGKMHDLAFSRCLFEGIHLFLPSGLEFEDSPSYHAFVLWHLRDFRLLALRRGETLPPEYENVIRKAVRVLSVLCRPDGKLLTINDSYQCDAAALIESLGRQTEKADFTVIDPGGIAVGRTGKCYASMDVSSYPGMFSHTHGGKNAPTVLWDGIPFIDDAGCPNYDTPQFPKCKRSEWHSSLLINGQGDYHQSSLYGFDGWSTLSFAPEWVADPEGGRTFTASLTSNVPAWKGVTWTRKLTVRETGVRIRDEVLCRDGSRTCTLLFNLAPEITAERKTASHWLLRSGKQECLFTLNSGDIPLTTSVIGTIENCQQRQIRPAPQFQLTFAPCEKLTCQIELIFR